MSAFLLVQGVETLPQRMRDHVANAKVVSEWLDSDSRIDWVKYAGLASHPHNARAKKYLPEGPGSVFSFGVKGAGSLTSREAGEKFINSVKLASHLANIGDVRTLVIHPASTTHRQLTDAQLLEAGVPQDLIRISVGLEDVEDILWDLDQALTIASGKSR
jgi:O-acetylhomoserine (thiol)-lyase